MDRVRLTFMVEVDTKQLPRDLAEFFREAFDRIIRDEMYGHRTLYGPAVVASSMEWRNITDSEAKL